MFSSPPRRQVPQAPRGYPAKILLFYALSITHHRWERLMQELEKRLGLLRLLLADVQIKQAQVSDMELQYKAQLSRIVDFVVHREGDVANALSLMAEVQGKLDEVAQTAGHLKLVE